MGPWGPLILGHAPDDVVAAVAGAASRGLSFGAPTALELEMAELLTSSLPSLEQVRLVSSGTEAVMSALRLARGFTGRRVIVKFEGCYHGHSDFLLVKAGSGALTFGNPTSAGVPAEFTAHTLVLDYNDAQQVEDAFAKFGDDIAAVVLEPVAGNMNFVRPSDEFIRALRAITARPGPVLIFDEVITGFRVGPQARRIFGVRPDLDARQGDRRRHAGGRFRRTARHHAEVGTRGSVSGRNAVGKPGRGFGGTRDAQARAAAGLLRPARRHHKALVDGGSRSRAASVIQRHGMGGMFGFYFRDELPRSFAGDAGGRGRGVSSAMLGAAFISRRRRTRQDSSRPHGRREVKRSRSARVFFRSGRVACACCQSPASPRPGLLVARSMRCGIDDHLRRTTSWSCIAASCARQVKDSLDKLRTHLNELRAASRLGAATGDSEAFVEIDRRAGEVETELDYLAKQVSADTPLPTFESLAPAARLLVVHARSISAARSVRGPLSATNLAREAERVEADAIAALERSDAAVTARINDRTLAQIQTAERLRRYVTWLLLGSVGGLTGLFIAYRRVQIRERAAQSRIERLAHFDMLTGLPNRAAPTGSIESARQAEARVPSRC